jgi:alpha-tubulin suppressor-like RCC1 family protein
MMKARFATTRRAGEAMTRTARSALCGSVVAATQPRLQPPRHRLHAWGNADCGQLGVALLPGDKELDTVGRTVHAPRHVPVPGAPLVADASCGAAHTAVALGGGELLTCGLDHRGQLGAAPRVDRTRGRLSRVPGLPPVRAVAAGGAHTLAVARDGRLYSFGCNARGQLGRTPVEPSSASGTTATGTFYAATRDSVPGLVTALADAGERVVAAAAGADFSIALGETGRVYTWGAGDVGKLAHGLPASSHRNGGGWATAIVAALLPRGRRYAGDESRPRLVKALEGEPASAVFAGAHCAGALLRNGRFVVWGNGRGYMLGNGREADVWEPEPALEAVTPAANGKIAFGLTHTLFLTGNGAVYAAGAGDHGCLGVGSQDAACEPVHVPLPGNAPATDVAAGWCVSLAARANGPVLAWGCGSAGALGRGLDIIDCWTPEPVRAVEGGTSELPARHVAAPSSGRHALAW